MAYNAIHETTRKPRGVGSSSTDCSPASCARGQGDESGCGGWCEYVIGEALERRSGAWRRSRFGKPASPRPRTKTDACRSAALTGSLECGCRTLGISLAGMELLADKG